MRVDPGDRASWTEDPLAAPVDGFELCYECDGAKLCNNEEPHPYCKGWCHICGGAGQWPLDPATPCFAPVPPLINLEYRTYQRSQR